ncbi:jg3680 [Pararge aegeria aegeria]|uniref:Jg3680 protein n=1 Tax=Pararge aegeria aegeria TaxID=348720 RepID=A0A8S4S5W1_9NEOP|nr:jg3680 [Pararge aegeria aegeria]
MAYSVSLVPRVCDRGSDKVTGQPFSQTAGRGGEAGAGADGATTWPPRRDVTAPDALKSNRAEVQALAGRHPRVDVSHSPPDVAEPWGSSHGELSRSPHSPGDAVATPQVVSGKCLSENRNRMFGPRSSSTITRSEEDLPIFTVERITIAPVQW